MLKYFATRRAGTILYLSDFVCLSPPEILPFLINPLLVHLFFQISHSNFWYIVSYIVYGSRRKTIPFSCFMFE